MIDKVPPQSLLEFFAGKFLTRYFRGKSKDVHRTYRNAISRFWLYLDREPTTDDLAEQTYCGFRTWLADCGSFARATQRTTLQRLRTVWRAAHKDGLTTADAPTPHWHAGGLVHAPRKPPKIPSLDALVASPEMRQRPATPRAFIAVYGLERGIADGSYRLLHYKLNSFEKTLGRPAEFADFNDMEINLCLAALLKTGLDPTSVKGVRTGLLSLWRAMDEHMLVDCLPRRVRKVKVPSKPPRAWNMQQLTKLLRTASGLRGCFKLYPEIRRANFWRGFVLVAYGTGLRLGDLLALRWDQISEDGMLRIVMRKTGDTITARLSAETLMAIGPLHRTGKPRVFGDLLGRGHVMEHFKRLVHTAGLKEGTSKWLRRSSATQIEIVSPGGAKAFLGHRTHGLADRNYIDATIVQREKPTPPRIEGPK